jgi:hypothetical protein
LAPLHCCIVAFIPKQHDGETIWKQGILACLRYPCALRYQAPGCQHSRRTERRMGCDAYIKHSHAICPRNRAFYGVLHKYLYAFEVGGTRICEATVTLDLMQALLGMLHGICWLYNPAWVLCFGANRGDAITHLRIKTSHAHTVAPVNNEPSNY